MPPSRGAPPRALIVLLASIALVVASVAAFALVRDRAEREARARRDAQLDRATEAVRQRVDRSVIRLEDLATALRLQTRIDDRRWRTLTAWVRRDGDLPSIALIREVPDRERPAFERAIGPIVEARAGGPRLTRPAPARSIHLATERVAARAGQPTPSVGIDFAGNPDRRAAMRGASRTGRLTATRIVRLIPSGQRAVVFYAPVLGSPRRFLGSAFAAEHLVEAVAPVLPRDATYRIADRSGVLATRGQLDRPAVATLRIGGRPWTVRVGTPPAAIGSAWLTLIAGLSLSALVLMLLTSGLRRERRALRLAVEHDERAVAADRGRDSAERRFRVAFDRAPIGMLLVGHDGRVLQSNQAMTQITGHLADDMTGRDTFAIVHPDDRAELIGRAAALPVTRADESIEARVLHAAGHVVWVQLRMTLVAGGERGEDYALVQVLDITEQRRHQAELRHLAEHDPLTGLANRHRFEAVLEEHLARVRRYGSQGAVLVLDLDGFKYVNDVLGHSVGDELITACAAALAARLRDTDVLARLGGDEFAVLLPAGTAEDAEAVAGAILRAVRESVGTFAGARHKVTASVGIAGFDVPLGSGEEALVNADLAMYDAKDAGGDCWRRYADGESHEPRIRAQMAWVDRITRALEEDRFALVAQPILDLQARRVDRHEVLVRMIDEQGDQVPPASFLPIAERFGLAPEIDLWVLKAAIAAMAEARAAGSRLPLTVNVSGASIGDDRLVMRIASAARTGRIDPDDLTIELTETAAVADIPTARRFADAVRTLGCSFAIDDFGAGFGSFSYLKHLPFDVLKLDGQYVRNAAENHDDQLIIDAVSRLARGMGREVVAEYVPDDDVVALLISLGVRLGQGFHLGRPRPLRAIVHEAIGAAPARGEHPVA